MNYNLIGIKSNKKVSISGLNLYIQTWDYYWQYKFLSYQETRKKMKDIHFRESIVMTVLEKINLYRFWLYLIIFNVGKVMLLG